MRQAVMVALLAAATLVSALGCGPREQVVVETQEVVMVQPASRVAPTAEVAAEAPAKIDQCLQGPSDADATGGLDVVQLSLSYNHSCALMEDSTVRCWGDNTYASLGDGSTTNRRAPVQVVGLEGAEEICTGTMLSCARMTDGTVRCWGNNSANQASGESSRLSILREPTKVAGISRAVGLTCGSHHACVLRVDGSVWCWGKGVPRNGASARVRLPGKARLVRAGAGGTCAIVGDDQVYCWSTDEPPSPSKVEGFSDRLIQLAVGERFNCAVTKGGVVSCWGEGYEGQLGTGVAGESAAPQVVPKLYGVQQIEAEGDYVCARTKGAELHCWGNVPSATKFRASTERQMVPTKVEPLAPILNFSLGKRHFCAQPGPRMVCCMGDNRAGQLGTNERQSAPQPTLTVW